MKITLKCWSCGKTLIIDVNKEPQFAYELIQIANASGWYGIVDTDRSRSLIFCSAECIDAQRKKDGGFRKIPKKKKGE